MVSSLRLNGVPLLSSFEWREVFAIPWEKVARVAFYFFAALAAAVFGAYLCRRERAVVQPEPPPAPPAPPTEANGARSSLCSPPLTPRPLLQLTPVAEPQQPIPPSPYNSLRLTNSDKEIISFIITTIDDASLLSLATWGPELSRRGDELEKKNPKPVHPFKFLEAIFADPILGPKGENLFQTYPKRLGVMKGINRGLRRELKINNLEAYIDPFAQKMGVSAHQIRVLLQGGRDKLDWTAFGEVGEWEPLVYYLINSGTS